MILPESIKSADPGAWAIAFVDSHPSIHYNVMLKWFKSAIAAGRAEAPPREPITIILESTIGPNSTRQWAHDDVVNAGIAAIKAKYSRKPEYHEIVKLDDDQCRKCGERGLHLCRAGLEAQLERAKRALKRAGFEDFGGDEWTPPINTVATDLHLKLYAMEQRAESAELALDMAGRDIERAATLDASYQSKEQKAMRIQVDESRGIVTWRENPPARTAWGTKTAKPGHVEIDTEGQ